MTGAGMKAMARLMRKALLAMQVDGVAYLLIDREEDIESTSMAAEVAAGVRGIIKLVDADNVVDWQDRNGALVAADIRGVASPGDLERRGLVGTHWRRRGIGACLRDMHGALSEGVSLGIAGATFRRVGGQSREETCG